jgi:CDP-glucose 4,6-dehydratase
LATNFQTAYGGRRVFVTGHTGFKGSWLCLWLEHLGARVTGYALAPSTEPSHYALLDLALDSVIADLKDGPALHAALEAAQPEIVFHLAAQPIVLRSYEDPLETFETNVLGTARLLEACRHVESVQAVIVVTTDKCYENREWIYGYREDDRLGGHDPYSASKAAAELVTASFRRSFFETPQGSRARVATARAGNVIGGGDWTEHRLVPDVMRAASESRPVRIRNPGSSRPWQHVLEPLSGYLTLGAELLAGRQELATAWNFGPGLDSNLTTAELFALMQRSWPEIRCELAPQEQAPHEAGLLMLDSTKARRELGWRPTWNLETTLHETVRWYRTFYEEGRAISEEQLAQYVEGAARLGVPWAR